MSRGGFLAESTLNMAGIADRFIVDPLSPFRVLWDAWLLVCVLISLVLLPIHIAMYYHLYQSDVFELLTVMDGFFLLDILCTLRTSYADDEGFLVRDAHLIRKRYIYNGMFFLDLLSCLPYDILIANVAPETWKDEKSDFTGTWGALRLNRVFRVLRLPILLQTVRLWRIPTLVAFFPFLQREHVTHRLGASGSGDVLNDRRRLSHAMLQIFLLLLLVALYLHWNACAQVFAVRWGGIAEDSWVDLADKEDASDTELWSIALMGAASNMASNGYGLITPKLVHEVWLLIISMIFGGCIYGVMISNMSTLTRHVDAGSVRYGSKMELYEGYMRYRQLPHKLRTRIRAFFRYRWRHGQLYDEASILSELSPSLRNDIAAYLARDLILKVPFFQGATSGFLSTVVSYLVPQSFLPGDILCYENEISLSMYFILKGEVEIVANGVAVTTLGPGAHVGEMSLLRGEKRSATVIALTYVDVYMLHEDHFHRLMSEYPSLHSALLQIGARRKQNTDAVVEQKKQHQQPRAGS